MLYYKVCKRVVVENWQIHVVFMVGSTPSSIICSSQRNLLFNGCDVGRHRGRTLCVRTLGKWSIEKFEIILKPFQTTSLDRVRSTVVVQFDLKKS